MDTLSYKTISANPATVTKEWHVVDATDMVLGRLASEVAAIIRGKRKPSYSPHVDCGDHVIVINAEKINLTGSKWEDKEYLSYSLYPGGQKRINATNLMAKKPTAVVEKAVKGMIPKTKLGTQVLKNLHVYAGAEHPHAAQKPQTLKF